MTEVSRVSAEVNCGSETRRSDFKRIPRERLEMKTDKVVCRRCGNERYFSGCEATEQTAEAPPPRQPKPPKRPARFDGGRQPATLLRFMASAPRLPRARR